jgi:hypothetical protein
MEYGLVGKKILIETITLEGNFSRKLFKKALLSFSEIHCKVR